jgi:hypothetical protein
MTGCVQRLVNRLPQHNITSIMSKQGMAKLIRDKIKPIKRMAKKN